MIPYRDFAAFALVSLGWTPDVFWASTPHELFIGIHGHRMVNDREYAKREHYAQFRKQFDGQH